MFPPIVKRMAVSTKFCARLQSNCFLAVKHLFPFQTIYNTEKTDIGKSRAEINNRSEIRIADASVVNERIIPRA